MSNQPMVGVEHRPFNYRLREARLVLGWTRARLAREAGVQPTAVGDYEALKRWPSPAAQERIASALRDDPASLFPAELAHAMGGRVARTVVSVLPNECLSLDDPSMLELTAGDDMEEWIEQRDLAEQFRLVLDSMAESHQVVLQARFGLIDGIPRTLASVAEKTGYTPERVRQIETQALRRMRHPNISKPIRDCAWGVREPYSQHFPPYIRMEKTRSGGWKAAEEDWTESPESVEVYNP